MLTGEKRLKIKIKSHPVYFDINVTNLSGFPFCIFCRIRCNLLDLLEELLRQRQLLNYLIVFGDSFLLLNAQLLSIFFFLFVAVEFVLAKKKMKFKIGQCCAEPY
jgi:hypothetical protein